MSEKLKDFNKDELKLYRETRRTEFLSLISDSGMLEELEIYVEEKIPEVKQTKVRVGKNIELIFREENVLSDKPESGISTKLVIGGMQMNMKNGKRSAQLIIETDGDNVKIVEDTTSGTLEAVKMLEVVLSTVRLPR